MSNVVYLITSLPSLTFGHQPPISLQEFMHDAQFQLSEKVYQKLEALDIQQLDTSEGTTNLQSAVERYMELETDKLEIRHAERESRTPNVINIPNRVMEKNPLELEKFFMKALWDELDSIDATEHFTMTEVFVYKLKLQILERLHSFNTEKGLEILDKVVNPPQETTQA